MKAEKIVLSDLETLSQEAARRWVEIARKSVEERGRFSIALSGGSTPRRLYEIMASSPLTEQAPWAQTYVFWGDERRVPHSHEDSCYRMARETLLEHVPVPEDHIFRMQGVGLANEGRKDYNAKLTRYFSLGFGEWPRFDLMLLGLGADGHFASIFPGTRAVSDLTNMIVVYEIPKLHKERITLTLPVFSNARNVMFLVAGEDKAPALAATLEGPHQPSTYPAQSFETLGGPALITWLIDQKAASQLKQK